MVVQGDGEHDEHDLGGFLRVIAADGTLSDALADDIGQDGFQPGDQDADKSLVNQRALLHLVEGGALLLAFQLRGGLQAGVENNLQFLERIHAPGGCQSAGLLDGSGVGTLNYSLDDIIF